MLQSSYQPTIERSFLFHCCFSKTSPGKSGFVLKQLAALSRFPAHVRNGCLVPNPLSRRSAVGLIRFNKYGIRVDLSLNNDTKQYLTETFNLPNVS